MTAVLVALSDVGPGVQLEEQLQGAGLEARWDAAQADGPHGSYGHPTVVLLDGDRLGAELAAVAARWRDVPSVPGVIAIGITPDARAHATAARVTHVPGNTQLPALVAAIRDAERLRLAAGMRWPILRAAVKLPPTTESPTAWQPTLAAARTVDIEIPRTALRWHVHHYATPTAKLDELREERVLSVPELEASAKLDGTTTVQTIVKAGPLDPMQSARLLWALGSLGALDFTPEVRDVATPERRRLAELRAHLRGRAARLEKSTFYDVLEITPLAEYPDIEQAYQLLAQRYSPQALASYDLPELASTIAPMWELVEKARSVLVDHAARGRYHDWLRQKLSELRTVWSIDPTAVKTAEAAYARGQKALGEGDVHRAMSEFATACRHFPGNPELEAHLAWARFRVQVGSGRDRAEAARAERKTIEAMLVGCRPWPRALVALALICAAGNDPDTARWHLVAALAADPTLPAAVQLAQRLGIRR